MEIDERFAVVLEMGAICMQDAAAECTTVHDYAKDFAELYRKDPEKAREVWAQYEEIIKDELNHALRFTLNGFCKLTGVEPDTDGLEDDV